MPLTHSALKAERRDRRRTLVNLKIEKNFKTALKKARRQPTAKNLSLAYSAIDKTSKKHLIHANKAARLKSRLAKLAQKTAATPKTVVKKAKSSASKKSPNSSKK